ncbi:MAG: thioredoxin family protein [Prevotella sp.]|nr:thioredoxin family protein [Prevotella sp.]
MIRRSIKMLAVAFVAVLHAAGVMAQGDIPVHFSVQQKVVSPTEVDVIFTGKIDNGWHVYSTGLPADGPVSATLTTEKAEGVKPLGKLKAQGKEISNFDQVFGMKLRYFEKSVTFVQRYQITGKTYTLKGYLEYGACNDENCMPPTQVEFSYSGKGPEGAPEAKEEVRDGAAEVPATVVSDTLSADTSAVAGTSSADIGGDLWKPVIKELQAFNGDNGSSDRSLLYIFLMGLAGGFVALFTPCVWPIIPMTVSFFLKRAKDKKKGVRDAITYGVSIIVIYLTLGIALTVIFGASFANALATNAVVNIIFCLLLVVFALSFFGWFELTLPSSWTNKIDSKASSTSGLLSIFLMAFTLALVSFSCTGPIIGFLLVEVTTSGSYMAPAMGMFGFALALALPFTLFALFPTWLKQAPKSGSWMNTIKVVLGFIELAFALKFFSVADLAYGWGLLDREVFLALWIVIFGMLGLYLIGKLKFQSDMYGEDKPMPVACIMLGMVSFAFVVYMVPGLWGAPCKAVSAFAPPMNTQDFNLYHNEVKPQYTDYEEGLAAAASQGKPVLIDFTGFGCVNCRKMEASVWTDPQVADILNNDYILISLYVDDKRLLAKTMEVTLPDGTRKTLRTIGDKWSYLQQSKFGALVQPFYVPVDAQGNVLGGSFSYKEDVGEYVEFLKKGMGK